MYKLALSAIILVCSAAGSYAQDLLIERDSAGELAGRYDSLNSNFRSAAHRDGTAVAEITVNDKSFVLRLYRGKIQELDIVPLSQDAQKLKNSKDSKQLASLYQRLIRDFDHTENNTRVLLRFIEYLVEFFPENAEFGGLVRDSAPMATPLAATPLCDNRGVLTLGQYSPRLNPFDLDSEFAIVGDPVSDCLGRCGIACLQFESGGQFLTPARAYTQGCLDHDLCAVFTGDALGNCTDEFLIASDDYLLGPNCASDITGTWEVIAYRNENQIQQINRATVIFFEDGTLSVVNGTTGTWSRTFNYIEFSAAGLTFLAYGSATDMVLEGRMDEGGTSVGYWTGVHLTTSTEAP